MISSCLLIVTIIIIIALALTLTLTLIPRAIPLSTQTSQPSSELSMIPSNRPSFLPSLEPSSVSTSPSLQPTSDPSTTPTNRPSFLPSLEASVSTSPSLQPNSAPSTTPSSGPSSSNEPSCVRVTNWEKIGQDIDGENDDDFSGSAVSISNDGNKVAIGAYGNSDNGPDSGHVRVYQFDSESNDWLQKGGDIDGEASGDEFGTAVLLSGDGNILAAGSQKNDGNGNNSGQVRIFQFDSESDDWLQKGEDINGEVPGDEFGSSVSLSDDGNIVAIGAHLSDANGNNSGHVRVYQFDSESDDWLQKGGDIDGVNDSDRSGGSVSLSQDGNTVAIGAVGNDDKDDCSGHVRVFQFDSDSDEWLQKGEDINGEARDDELGWSVSLSDDGNIVAIGAHLSDVYGYNSGHVTILQFDSEANDWLQIGEDIAGENYCDEFGTSVSLSGDGNIVAIGAHLSEQASGYDTGHATILQFDSEANDWLQIGEDIAGENYYDEFGGSVSLSQDGNTVAIGSGYHSNPASNSYYSGHVRIYRVKSVCN